MKIRLHKPKQNIWTIALVLFIAGVVVPYLPVVANLAFLCMVFSAALLLLGTWLF